MQPVVIATGLVRSQPLASTDTGSALFLEKPELVAQAATPILLFLVGVTLENARVRDVALLPALTTKVRRRWIRSAYPSAMSSANSLDLLGPNDSLPPT